MSIALGGAIAAAVLLAAVGFPDAALAQAKSPFGVGLPEAGASGAGSGVIGWIIAQQAAFYRELTATVTALKSDGTALWGLVGLSFLYGVLHAAGPGHGKAVVTSYVLADGQTLKRGIALSFVSAFVQATVAVAMVGLLAGLFRVTAMTMTSATWWLEVMSFALVTALGLYLVATRVLRLPGVSRWRRRPARAVDQLFERARPAGASLSAALAREAPDTVVDTDGRAHAIRFDGSCATCGGFHIPDAAMVARPDFDLKQAIAAVFAVGLRPCTGAIVVLVFALSQGLLAAGILAAYAMGVGTAITVAILAALAVGARDVVAGYAGGEGSRWGGFFLRTAEILGALAVLAFGVTLLTATLVSGGLLGG